ncbi:glycoside hydrolase [Paenibacillus lycopersici]|uniref:Glycoside hydrolase n=1 Tax=Paenibacillus lycopersici TaxID=2704462 RepID=A0A6C0G0P1_9BACL|nr:S-layer homology domain-containing protein [Paenibacillus lycopersici]QHT61423.1 glycoside hydrolase [Paenibacillus lycopersici]
MLRLLSIRQTIVVGLLAVMMASLPLPFPATAAAASSVLPYDDIRSNYATESIVNMTKLNIITGMGDRRFEPDTAVTRAQFITMLDRLLGIAPVTSAIAAFSDVAPAAWYYEWVMPAIQLNIVQGMTAASFEPNRPVSRQEAAVMIARALKQSLSASTAIPTGLYMDQEQVGTWAAAAVMRLTEIGLMGGDQGRFRPQASMTRQEAAVMLNRIWTYPGWKAKLQAPPPSSIQLGWQYGQTTAQFEKQVAQSSVNTVSPRWFFLGQSGALEDQTDASLLLWARQQGKRVWAMVGNHSSQEATHAMLSDAGKRQAFILQLAERVRKNGIDGLNIDFENMMPEDRSAFTAFITALHQQLKTVPAVLSVNVSPDFGTDWTDVFDYHALSVNADYIVLMGYDEHWDGDPEPGSVSSLPWLRTGIDRLLGEAAAGKIILALPLYSREWTRGKDGSYTSEEISLLAQNRAILANKAVTAWDDTLGQYVSAYIDSLLQRRIWLEDGRSLTRKTEFVHTYSLAGSAYWYIGGESTDVWASISNANKYDAYDFTS